MLNCCLYLGGGKCNYFFVSCICLTRFSVSIYLRGKFYPLDSPFDALISWAIWMKSEIEKEFCFFRVISLPSIFILERNGLISSCYIYIYLITSWRKGLLKIFSIVLTAKMIFSLSFSVSIGIFYHFSGYVLWPFLTDRQFKVQRLNTDKISRLQRMEKKLFF